MKRKTDKKLLWLNIEFVFDVIAFVCRIVFYVCLGILIVRYLNGGCVK